MPYLEPGQSGHANTDTSRRVAEETLSYKGRLHRKILDTLHGSILPMTADQIAAELGMDILSIRPRVTELKNRNLIRDSGQRGLSSRGKQMIAWEVN